MQSVKLPVVGDVIKSKEFSIGVYGDVKKEYIQVGLSSRTVLSSYSDEERLSAAKEQGKILPSLKEIDLNANDDSRGTAEFVVELAKKRGDDMGNNLAESNPRGWLIWARRLNTDGTYDPSGEVIKFYMSGYSPTIEPEEVEIIRQMKMLFV